MGCLCSSQKGSVKKETKDYKPVDSQKVEKKDEKPKKDAEKQKKSEDVKKDSSDNSPVQAEPATADGKLDKSKKEKSDKINQQDLYQSQQDLKTSALEVAGDDQSQVLHKFTSNVNDFNEKKGSGLDQLSGDVPTSVINVGQQATQSQHMAGDVEQESELTHLEEADVVNNLNDAQNVQNDIEYVRANTNGKRQRQQTVQVDYKQELDDGISMGSYVAMMPDSEIQDNQETQSEANQKAKAPDNKQAQIDQESMAESSVMMRGDADNVFDDVTSNGTLMARAGPMKEEKGEQSDKDSDKKSDKSKSSKKSDKSSKKSSKSSKKSSKKSQKSDKSKSDDDKESSDYRNEDHQDVQEIVEEPGEPLQFTIPTQGKFFDEPNQQMLEAFSIFNEGSNLQRCESISLSGNSFGMDACQWIAENVLAHCISLKRVDFSDIFTTRARDKLPASLKFMIDAIIDKGIVELNLSHNAFGPDGVTAYVEFLEKCPTLKILNVTNCGLGPQGSSMIAEAILKNDQMRLTEFSASRDRLENPGIEALSRVFSAHGTLKKIEVYQNGIRKGLKHMFKALLDCADTIEYVDCGDNLIKRETADMIEFIKTCRKVKYLNISDSLIKKNQQIEVVDALFESIQTMSALQKLVWNQDPKKSTVNYFVDKMSSIPAGYSLQKVEMAGIFMKQDNRQEIKKMCRGFFFSIVLFKADFSDDESGDHDDSEEDTSSDDGESSGGGDDEKADDNSDE